MRTRKGMDLMEGVVEKSREKYGRGIIIWIYNVRKKSIIHKSKTERKVLLLLTRKKYLGLGNKTITIVIESKT